LERKSGALLYSRPATYTGTIKLVEAFLHHKGRKKKDNVLLIDCGDTFQGNPVSIVEKGNIAAKIMNFLVYDVWVPGNHEFDFGSSNILRLSLLLKSDMLMANVVFNPPSSSVKTWKLYQKNSLRIAVIGMTFPYLKNSIWGNERGTFDVEGINKALDRVIRKSWMHIPI
jgi:2',3'-cyclic-nucleotide 2'-phosphodiesterase (5'-nucleotidase family)